MDITATIARTTGVTIWAVLEERAENVVDVYNYIVEKGEKKQDAPPPKKDDGFWDF